MLRRKHDFWTQDTRMGKRENRTQMIKVSGERDLFFLDTRRGESDELGTGEGMIAHGKE